MVFLYRGLEELRLFKIGIGDGVEQKEIQLKSVGRFPIETNLYSNQFAT